MLNQEIQQPASPWLSIVHQAVSIEYGHFSLQDNLGKPIVLEWRKMGIQSPELAEVKKEVCEIACEVLAPAEAEFLRAYPHMVKHEFFLQSCAELLTDPKAVDWNRVTNQIKVTLKQFFLADIASFGKEAIGPLLNDVYFFITAKDKETGNLLGFISFAITPALPMGDIKLMNLAVPLQSKERGLEKILLSAIFKLIPQTERVFVGTRSTSRSLIELYRLLGFTDDLAPLQDPNHQLDRKYWAILEYKARQCNLLQLIANTFK
jgi:ribosomal protein S18 acetylase RimI-like enzyme